MFKLNFPTHAILMLCCKKRDLIRDQKRKKNLDNEMMKDCVYWEFKFWDL